MDSLIQKLERGKESCNQMINMLQKLQSSSSSSSSSSVDELYDDDDKGNNRRYLKGVDDHCKVVETTLDDVLVMLRSHDFIQHVIQMRNTKLSPTHFNHSPNQSSKFQHNFALDIPNHVNSSRDRRGCYKRRRHEQEKVIETRSLTDDGHAWRKYGQKIILHATHPRNYYRCTHKYEERCEASKQVQQISENPPKYKIIYHGQHTCKAGTSKNNPTILFDSIDDNKNSILLSFETGKQGLNNYPFMFPPTTPSSSSSSSGVAMLNGSSIKEEVIASEPLNRNQHTSSSPDHYVASEPLNRNQYTSSSPDHYVAPSPAITAVSDNVADVISSTNELYSSVSSVHGMDADECYSNILADVLIDLDDIYNQPNPFMMTKLMTLF